MKKRLRIRPAKEDFDNSARFTNRNGEYQKDLPFKTKIIMNGYETEIDGVPNFSNSVFGIIKKNGEYLVFSKLNNIYKSFLNISKEEINDLIKLVEYKQEKSKYFELKYLESCQGIESAYSLRFNGKYVEHITPNRLKLLLEVIKREEIKVKYV